MSVPKAEGHATGPQALHHIDLAYHGFSLADFDNPYQDAEKVHLDFFSILVAAR